ncbi:MAG: hypothetical protein HOP03_14435 [Lysobacter sp.]|nr:hypothetical protein [Lysobacter sp.]
MDEHKAFLVAARDTLMHIAGVSGTAAKRLRPGQSLEVDLGVDAPGFIVLAEYQRRVGDRLRTDGERTWIEAEALYESVVWDVFSQTVRRAIGRRLEQAEAVALLDAAQAGLRGDTS